MKNQNNNESKKLFLGLVISGVVAAGVAVAYGLHNAQNGKRPLKRIGQTISQIGEMIEHCELDKDAAIAIENVEQKVSGSDVFNNLTVWLDTGLTLWKKFKKGS